MFFLRVFGSIALVLPRTNILLIDKRLPLIPERNMSVKILFGQVVVAFHNICHIQNFQLNVIRNIWTALYQKEKEIAANQSYSFL